MRRSLLNLLPVLAALPTLAGCPGRMCTDMYVPDSVLIDFEADGFEAGDWEVVVGDHACTLVLPGTEADIECDSDAIELEVRLTADGAGISEVLLTESAPASLPVEVLHDGAVVFSDDLSPTYEEDEPNGKGCGITRHGSATVAL